MKIMNDINTTVVASPCSTPSLGREMYTEVLYGEYITKRKKCDYCQKDYLEVFCPFCGMTKDDI